MIGVDQGGIPADRMIDDGYEQVFGQRQQNGTWDIGIFNTDTCASQTFSVSLAQLGLTGSSIQEGTLGRHLRRRTTSRGDTAARCHQAVVTTDV